MLRVALGLRLDKLPSTSQQVTRCNLPDLMAQAYLAEVRPLLHSGLAKGYRTTQTNGHVYRGRLKVRENVRENLTRADRFFTEYQLFDHDILINRLLAAALEVLSWSPLSPGVAAEVDATLAALPEFEGTSAISASFARVRLTRATQRYAPALRYAELILTQQGPQLRAGRDHVFALLFDMNILWERYVAVLLRRVAPPGLTVHTQERHPFWLPERRPVRRVRPDIVVRTADSDVRLVIDTKWKVPTNGLPSDDDLKQMFVYNELLGGARAALLYPRTSISVEASGSYAARAHACEQFHLGLFENHRWSTHAMKRQLKQLVACLVPRESPEQVVDALPLHPD
jgi:5-methylcytosine-specific restriction enzyme subunit McrC